jgi:hypothetical protein
MIAAWMLPRETVGNFTGDNDLCSVEKPWELYRRRAAVRLATQRLALAYERLAEVAEKVKQSD